MWTRGQTLSESPGPGVTGSYVSQCGSWVPNRGPLEEQYVLVHELTETEVGCAGLH